MAKLPQKLSLDMMQVRWATELDPLLQNPILKGQVLKNIELKTGANTVPTKLSRNLQGWFIVRQRGSATFYDEQDFNAYPNLYLTLVSSADVSVDIWVY